MLPSISEGEATTFCFQFPETAVAPSKLGSAPAGDTSLVALRCQNLFLVSYDHIKRFLVLLDLILVLYNDIQSFLILLDGLLVFQDQGLVFKNRLLIGEDLCFWDCCG